ncbi:hypothetical protein [uncultured Algoriphagus sp.]|nr:hypothetical protein [uncultured Algoriphagus sp.]
MTGTKLGCRARPVVLNYDSGLFGEIPDFGVAGGKKVRLWVCF